MRNVAANGLLDMRLLATLSMSLPQSVTVAVEKDGNVVSFDYAYLLPAARVSPVDAPIAGGTLVTISSVGLHGDGASVATDDIHVSFRSLSDVQVNEILQVAQGTNERWWSTLTVVLSVPPSAAAALEQDFMCLKVPSPAIVQKTSQSLNSSTFCHRRS